MAYSQEQKDEMFIKVITRIGKEKLSVEKACDGILDDNTFYKILEEDEEGCKKELYARAREARHTGIFEEMLDIADASENDTKILDDGREVVDNEAIQRSKLRIDTRKWMLSKMDKTKYGDKIDVTSDGEKIQEAKVELKIDGKDIELK